MKTVIYQYDGSWMGLLSCIFAAYEFRENPEIITSRLETIPLFTRVKQIHSSESNARRVIQKVKKKSRLTYKRIIKAFLSEKQHREILILKVIQLLLKDIEAAEKNYGNPHVLQLKQIEKMVNREIHRMHAFVRFQKAKDAIWYAFIQPDFDVMPLISNHFRDRYADQKWIIFDLKRQYGLFYDLEKIDFIQLDFNNKVVDGKLPKHAMYYDEQQYQNLWKEYFQSANIKERNNQKLHLRHVPKRYWKLLIEK